MKRLGFLARLIPTVLAAVPSWGAVIPDEVVSGRVIVDYETKVLSYGLPDSDDPNFLPFGELTFFGHLSVGSRFYLDTTGIGERMGRGDRRWDIWEIDFPVDLRHTFTPDEFAWLPTSVGIGVGYRYEYHPPRTHIADTQFCLADVSLPDLWIVPWLSYERDFIRDNGTYLNLGLSKEMELVKSVFLTPSVSQGWGDSKRVRGYLSNSDLTGPLDRAGLMDSRIQVSLAWRPRKWLEVSAFVAYSDFWFDRHIRDDSRNYIRQVDGGSQNTSWCFPVGVSVSIRF